MAVASIPLDEFYWVTFRKKLYRTLEELQNDLDEFLVYYNRERTDQGRWYFGKTPMQTFQDNVPLARDKTISGELAQSA